MSDAKTQIDWHQQECYGKDIEMLEGHPEDLGQVFKCHVGNPAGDRGGGKTTSWEYAYI